jgi:hypothetical protein
VSEAAAYSVSIWHRGERLRMFASLTRDAARAYVQELLDGGLPIENVDFGDGFDITITLPKVVHPFVKWIVEGGPKP